MAMTSAGVIAVLDALARDGIRVAVAGGWAIDALLGRETREHDDLDLAVDSGLVKQAIRSLDRVGLEVSMDQLPARLELRGNGMVVDFHPVTFASDGVGHQPGLAGEVYAYPVGSIDAVGSIGGREVTCLTPALLVRFHDGYEPRDVDRIDMALLAEAFDLSLPARYRS